MRYHSQVHHQINGLAGCSLDPEVRLKVSNNISDILLYSPINYFKHCRLITRFAVGIESPFPFLQNAHRIPTGKIISIPTATLLITQCK